MESRFYCHPTELFVRDESTPRLNFALATDAVPFWLPLCFAGMQNDGDLVPNFERVR